MNPTCGKRDANPPAGFAQRDFFAHCLEFPMKRMGKVLGIGVKLAISAALIWYAFRTIDAANAFRLLRSIHPGIVVLALGALALQQFLGGLRLKRLLELIHTPVSVIAAIDAVFVGLFFGTTFVSFISGDAMRVWRLARAGVPVTSAFQAILFDRIFGFVTLIAMIAMGLPLLLRGTPDRAILLGILAAVQKVVHRTAEDQIVPAIFGEIAR